MSLDLFARLTSSRCQLLTLFAPLTAALAFWSGAAMAGCNSGNVASPDRLDGANCQANAAGTWAVAVGQQASAPAFGGTAFGYDARASASLTTAIGWQSGYASAPNEGATTIGAGVGVHGAGYFSVAIGAGGGTVGNTTIALGVGTVAIGAGYTNHAYPVDTYRPPC